MNEDGEKNEATEGKADKGKSFFDLRVRITVARRGKILYQGSADCLEPGNEVLAHVQWRRGDNVVMAMTADCWPTLVACDTWTCGEDCVPATIQAAGCPI